MKHLLSRLCIGCLCFQPALAADLKPTIISGHVLNARDSSVTLTYLENPITGKVAAQRTVLSASSFFTFRFDISQPVSLQLEIPGAPAKVLLFAEAGDSIFLVCDNSVPVADTRFSGDGAIINQLLNELALTTGSPAERQKKFESGHDLSVPGFLNFYDSVYHLGKKVTQKWRDKLSPGAMGMILGQIYFASLKAKLEYLNRHRKYLTHYTDVFERVVFFRLIKN